MNLNIFKNTNIKVLRGKSPLIFIFEINIQNTFRIVLQEKIKEKLQKEIKMVIGCHGN